MEEEAKLKDVGFAQETGILDINGVGEIKASKLNWTQNVP